VFVGFVCEVVVLCGADGEGFDVRSMFGLGGWDFVSCRGVGIVHVLYQSCCLVCFDRGMFAVGVD
jgi:hypothetical protein